MRPSRMEADTCRHGDAGQLPPLLLLGLGPLTLRAYFDFVDEHRAFVDFERAAAWGRHEELERRE